MTDHSWCVGRKPDHAERLPWLTLGVFSVVFFLVYHDFWHAKVGAGEYDTSAQDLLTNLAAGTFLRTIALSLAGLVAVVDFLYRRPFVRFRFMGAFGWALFSFVALVFLSPLWAVDLQLTLKKLVEFGILGSVAISVVSRFAQREIILWTFFTTAGYLVLGIFAELFFGTFKPWISEYRFSGTLHPNSSGLECVLLIISAMVAADMEKRWRTPLRLGALLGLIFLILTGSRTSLAALLMAVVVYFAFVSSRRTAIAFTVVVSGLLCLLLAVATFGSLSDFGLSLLRGRQDPLNADSFTDRVWLWRDLGYDIRLRPVLGYGYGGFWNPTNIYLISAQEHWGVPESHSAYIEYLLNLGAAGLVAYILLLSSGTWRTFRLYKLSHDYGLIFCAMILIVSIVDGFLEAAVVDGSLLEFFWMVVLVRLAIDPQLSGYLEERWKPAYALRRPRTSFTSMP